MFLLVFVSCWFDSGWIVPWCFTVLTISWSDTFPAPNGLMVDSTQTRITQTSKLLPQTLWCQGNQLPLIRTNRGMSELRNSICHQTCLHVCNSRHLISALMTKVGLFFAAAHSSSFLSEIWNRDLVRLRFYVLWVVALKMRTVHQEPPKT